MSSTKASDFEQAAVHKSEAGTFSAEKNDRFSCCQTSFLCAIRGDLGAPGKIFRDTLPADIRGADVVV